MALVDTGADQWLNELDSCERLYSEIARQLSDRGTVPVGSNKYNTISASVRVHLKQLSLELNQLQDSLRISTSLTFEERERRQRLVEGLQSKNVHLNHLYKTNVNNYERRKLIGGDEPNWADDDDSPLLGPEETVESIQEQQQRMLADQEKGLENLASIISRQKAIGITMHDELDLQNEILDDIGTRMDSTNTAIRQEIDVVSTVSNTDSTWGYWLIIIVLFVCIVGIAI